MPWLAFRSSVAGLDADEVDAWCNHWRWRLSGRRRQGLKMLIGLETPARPDRSRRPYTIHPSSRALSLAACHARARSSWSLVSVRRFIIS